MKNNNIENDAPVSIALTGGSGFLGSRILTQLLDSGIHVRALQRHTKLLEHENLTPISGSLSDPSSLSALVKGATCVIHCGGAVAAHDVAGFTKANAQGTANLVKASENEGVQRFLYISSMAAREPDISPYAASKLAGEDTLKNSALNAWDIIRPPAIYGPGDMQMLPLIRLLQCRIGLLLGGRQAKVSLIYVDDLAKAVGCWLSCNTTKQSIYEIDDGQKDGYTWPALLGNVAEIINVRPFYMTPQPLLMAMVGYLIKSANKILGQTPFLTPEKLRELSHADWTRHNRGIEENIDWAPQTGFQEGMVQTLNWYQKQGVLKISKIKDA